MASLLEDADRKRALQLVADCVERCQSCGKEAAESGDESLGDCVAGCLDCMVVCRDAGTLLSRSSGFDVSMLELAARAAET